jgi:hypothetical protein
MCGFEYPGEGRKEEEEANRAAQRFNQTLDMVFFKCVVSATLARGGRRPMELFHCQVQ